MASRAPEVLIVDDEAAIRGALRRVFTRRGWVVTEAADGALAAEILLKEDPARFSAIISDLRMPGASGVELFDRVARERPDVAVKMIFSTGDAADEEARLFEERTGRPVLQKPFDIAALFEMAEQLRQKAAGD